MTDHISINPVHDPVALGETLRNSGRLQVSDFFELDSADYLWRLLQSNKDWYLAYNEGNQYFESSLAEFMGLEPALKQRFMNNINVRARTQFQYCFIQYYISQAIELNEQPNHPMHQMHEFMNSASTLAFMRTLTGEPAVRKADSYASCYSPGHFLTEHDDRHQKHDRVAAYVFSMNKSWNKNWGGHLAFYDKKGNIEEAFIPSFNTLNIFLISTQHAVQPVAQFAGASRLSYLGWLHR